MADREQLSAVSGKSEPFGQEHERIRENVVKFSVSCPERAVFWILCSVVGPWAVRMLQQLPKYVASYHGAGKARVPVELEGILQRCRVLLFAASECLLRRWKMGGDLLLISDSPARRIMP